MNGKITVGILGKGITVPLPDIYLSGLGSDSEEGFTLDEMAGEIMKVVDTSHKSAIAHVDDLEEEFDVGSASSFRV